MIVIPYPRVVGQVPARVATFSELTESEEQRAAGVAFRKDISDPDLRLKVNTRRSPT